MSFDTIPYISVCICTYMRQELLNTLLESLVKQTIPLSDYEILIADNDAAGSASQVVQQFSIQHPSLQIRYEIEPNQGISFARNRTVRMARGKLLAFIDDDELACPTWLADLETQLQLSSADAVFGPVTPIYPQGTSHWLIQSRFFERPRFSTGIQIPWNETRTSNALVQAAWAKQREPDAFDTQLAYSGGEDTDFFRWIESRGGRFFWCDSAYVSEVVPASRQTLSFILERSFRHSVTYWRKANSQRKIFWKYLEATKGLFGGMLFMLFGFATLPFGLGRAARLWATSSKAFGRVAALSDIELVGYKKKTHNDKNDAAI
nr:glycosyltransferase family 2 protein [uncultured Rhodoferax sp.]